MRKSSQLIALILGLALALLGCGKIGGGMKSPGADIESFKVTLNQNSISMPEGSVVSLVAVLDKSRPKDTVVEVSLSSPRNDVDSDFLPIPQSITIPARETTKSFDLTSIDDSSVEGEESFSIKLAGVEKNSKFPATEYIIKVTDNDSAAVQFASASQTVSEAAGTVTVSLSLSAAIAQNVVVPFTVSGSASGAGSDYADPASSVTISAGSTTANLTFAITDDSTVESSETVILTLGTPTNASAGSATVHTVTISDNDLGSFNITGITSAGDSTKDTYLNGALTPIVNWERSNGASSYDVTVYESNGSTVKCAAVNVVDPGAGTEASADLAACSGGNLTAGGTYKVKVTAKSATASRDGTNSLYTFIVNQAPTIHSAGNGPWYVISGGNISIAALWAAAPSVGVADDLDGDTLTFSSIGSPSSGVGTTTNNSTSVLYSASTVTGVDTFTFTISDGRGASVSGTMTIHVVTAFTWSGGAGDRDWATNSNWCGAVNTNKTGCANTGAEPTSSATTTHVAIFDGTCTASGSACSPNANANASYVMYGLRLNSGYSGTLTQVNKAITIGAGGYTHSAGTFTGDTSGTPANISLSGPFTLTGGTVNATNGTWTLSGLYNQTGGVFNAGSGTFNAQPSIAANSTFFSIGPSATFNAGTGTVGFSPVNGTFIGPNCTIDVQAAVTFNNVTVAPPIGGGWGSQANSIYLSASTTMTIAGTLSHNSGAIYNTWNVTGHFVVGASAGSGTSSGWGATAGGGGTGDVILNGSGNQTYKGSAGTTANLVVNKASGTVTEAVGGSGLKVNKFTLSQGSFAGPAGTMVIRARLIANDTIVSIASGTTFTPPVDTFEVSPINMNYLGSVGTVQLPDAVTFNNVTVAPPAGGGWGTVANSVTLSSATTITVSGTLAHNAGYIMGNTWVLTGNLAVGANAWGGSGLVTMTGTGAQTYLGSVGTTCDLTINKTGGSVTEAVGGASLRVGSFSLVQGTFVAPAADLYIKPSLAAAATIFSVANGTSFTPPGGTTYFSPGNSICFGNTTGTISVPASLVFGNVTLHPTPISTSGGCWGQTNNVASASVVNMTGSLTHNAGQLGGPWNTEGNLVIGTLAAGGGGTITMSGTGAQTYLGSSGTTASLTINKTGGSVSEAVGGSGLKIGSFSLAQGTFSGPAGDMTVTPSISVETVIFNLAAATTFNNQGGTLYFNPRNAVCFGATKGTINVASGATLGTVSSSPPAGSTSGGCWGNTNTVGLVSALTVNSFNVTTSSFLMQGNALTTTSAALNSRTLTKGTGVLTVNGVVQGTGSLFGGTVNP